MPAACGTAGRRWRRVHVIGAGSAGAPKVDGWHSECTSFDCKSVRMVGAGMTVTGCAKANYSRISARQ